MALNLIRTNTFQNSYEDSNRTADAAAAQSAAADLSSMKMAEAEADAINKQALDRNIRAGLRNANVPQQGAPSQQAPTTPTAPQGPSIRPAGGATSPAATSIANQGAAPNVPAQRTGGAPQPQQPQGGLRDTRQIVANAMMQTPGYGMEGAKLQMQQEEAELKTVLNLARSDPASAIAWADANGVPMPQGMKQALADKDFADYMTRTLELYEGLYPGNNNIEKRFKAFMTHMAGYMDEVAARAAQPGGVIPSAVQQNRPDFVPGDQVDPDMLPNDGTTQTAMKPFLKQQQDGSYVLIYPDGRPAVPVQFEGGESVMGPQSGSGGGKDPANVRTIKYMIDTGIAENERQAWELLNQAKTNPTQRARIVNSVYQGLRDDPLNAGVEQEVLIEEANRLVGLMMQEGAPASAPPPPTSVQGAGTVEDPFIATTQEQIDAIKSDPANKGKIIEVNGTKYRIP